MLKINLQTNRWIMIVAVIRLLLEVYTSISSFVGAANLTNPVYASLRYSGDLLQMILLYYMISILVFLKEKPLIKIAFLFYSGLYIIRVLFSFLARSVPASTPFVVSVEILGALSILSDIFLLIVCTTIANKMVKTPYLLFSGGIAIVRVFAMVINIFGPVLFRMNLDPRAYLRLSSNITNVSGLLILLAPVSVILLIKSISKLLKTEELQPFLY